MLLQCGSDHQGGDSVEGWVRSATLASLYELNEECLELCVQQARALPAAPLCSEIAQLWGALDAPARQRASGCLYLLLDAGFADADRWRVAEASQVGDGAGAVPVWAPWFTVPAALPLAQAVFTFAWHLTRCQGKAARLLLGMPAPCVRQLAQYTLGQVRSLAGRHPEWLRPRWVSQPLMWRQLLLAAASGDATALERARLRGQTLLAAETRPGTLGRPPHAHRPVRGTPQLRGTLMPERCGAP